MWCRELKSSPLVTFLLVPLGHVWYSQGRDHPSRVWRMGDLDARQHVSSAARHVVERVGSARQHLYLDFCAFVHRHRRAVREVDGTQACDKTRVNETDIKGRREAHRNKQRGSEKTGEGGLKVQHKATRHPRSSAAKGTARKSDGIVPFKRMETRLKGGNFWERGRGGIFKTTEMIRTHGERAVVYERRGPGI